MKADYGARRNRIVEAVRVDPDGTSPWSVLRRAFLEVGVDFEAERDRLLRRFRIVGEAPSVAERNLAVQATWESLVAETVADWLSVDTDDLRSRLVAAAALAAMRTSLHHWMATGCDSHLPDHIALCFDLIGAGLDSLDTGS